MLFYEREEQPVDVPAAAADTNLAEAQAADVVGSECSTKQDKELETPQTMVEPSSDNILPEASEETAEPTPAATSEASASTTASTAASTTEEEESETDTEDQQPVQEASIPVPKPAAQPPMRTARLNSQSDAGFPSPHRVMAAT